MVLLRDCPGLRDPAAGQGRPDRQDLSGNLDQGEQG